MRAIRSARFILWLGCVLAYFAATHAADRSPANMATAANALLSSLTPEQKKVAAFAFDNTAERERFGFVPTEMHPRVGLTIEKMTPPQREAAHNLLKSGLSQKGYMTATSIMELESILNANENFLSTVGYQLSEIQGKHHSMFCEQAYARSDDYRAFWAKLRSGQFVADEFKQRSSRWQ